jgi:hypothetical protein
MTRRPIAAIVVFVVSAFTQEPTPILPGVERAITTNHDLLKHLEFYTCRETIERFQPGADGHPVVRDIVQVDVGVGAKREMYSWPGEANFSLMDLGGLVGHGLLATGLFSGFAKDLFVVDIRTVRPVGEEMLLGQRALQFSYQVPPLNSQWQIRWNGETGQVGEDGQFWVNAENYRLLRLRVSALKIPPQLRLRSLNITLDYQLVNNTLVPARSSLDALEAGGAAFHNAAVFSDCHVFAVESKILDSESATATVLNEYKHQQPVISSGLTLRLQLNEQLSARDVIVGKLITARLESTIKISPGRTLPEGSILRGRVRRFEKLDDPPNTYLVGLSFAEMDVDGQTYRLSAELKSMERLAGIRTEISRSRNESIAIGISPGRKVGRSPAAENDDLAAPVMPGAAVFFLTNTESIPKGFRMIWRTTKVK